MNYHLPLDMEVVVNTSQMISGCLMWRGRTIVCWVHLSNLDELVLTEEDKPTDNKYAGTTHSSLFISPLLSATSSSPIQYNPHLPRPGTWVGGWIFIRAPMPYEVACPAGGRTNGTHMSPESPIAFYLTQVMRLFGIRAIY